MRATRRTSEVDVIAVADEVGVGVQGALNVPFKSTTVNLVWIAIPLEIADDRDGEWLGAWYGESDQFHDALPDTTGERLRRARDRAHPDRRTFANRGDFGTLGHLLQHGLTVVNRVESRDLHFIADEQEQDEEENPIHHAPPSQRSNAMSNASEGAVT